MTRVERRAFLVGTRALLAAPFGAEAQPPVIGFVGSPSIEAVPHIVAGFRQGLRETGYVEGQSVAIEFRSAEDDDARLQAIIAELVRRPVAVLVTNSTAARLTKAATTTIPIVVATGSDPIRDNLVASLNRPGGNVTGVSFLGSDLGGKKLEVLRALVPNARIIGVMENPNGAISQAERVDVQTATRATGHPVGRFLLAGGRGIPRRGASYVLGVPGSDHSKEATPCRM